jgi:DNA-binding CsgD family transcriptional regulator
MNRRSPLVGRTAERAGLLASLERCSEGHGGLVLISGEAGVGKSRLIAEALDGWPSTVLRGSAVAGGGGYAPFLDLPGVGPLTPRVGGQQSKIDRAAVVETLRLAVRRATGDDPAVLVLEDLHLADDATMDLLPLLTRAWASESLLVIGTYRSDQLPRSHSLRRVRTELRRDGTVIELALEPLSRQETGELLSGILGAPVSARLLTEVHDRSDGLPFFVEELAATLTETDAIRKRGAAIDVPRGSALPLPDTVVDAVLARTSDLWHSHREAVELAAVLGVRVHLPVLADLVPAEDLDPLLDSGLLIEQGRSTAGGPEVAAFRHPLVQDALYHAIPWARRRRHHMTVARRLTEHGALPEIVAEQWIAAHDDEAARPLLLAAAERNCALHAYRDAARLAQRALDMWPDHVDPPGRIAALERLAGCAELCDEHKRAADVWAAVVRLRQAAGDETGTGTASRRLANARQLLGDFPGAVDARETAAVAFAAAGDRGEAAEERLRQAEHLWSAAHNSRALEYAVAATADAEAAHRPDLRARALAMQGGIRATLGEGERGVELAREGLALALEKKLQEPAGEAYYQLATALLYTTDYGAAADAYESAFELCRDHDLTDVAQACAACLSVVVRLAGDWDRALSISAEVLDSDDAPPHVRMVAQEEAALITALRGDARRARGPLRRAAAFGRTQEIFGIEVGAMWGLAVVADLNGESHTALREVATLLERCAGKEEWHFALPALRWVSTFLTARGEGERAAECHRLLATAATRDSSPKVLSALAHAGGEITFARGDAAQAANQFGRAVELLQGIAAPYEQALSQLRWGAALAATGDRQAAADQVTSAYRTARQLGAKPLAGRCVTGLAEMGEQVDQRLGRLAARSLEPAGLTRREKQVLRLLGAGSSNREIAAELFVSPRTVDMHVRNVFAKLGCTSRLAAARRGAELGLVDAPPRPEVRQ